MRERRYHMHCIHFIIIKWDYDSSFVILCRSWAVVFHYTLAFTVAIMNEPHCVLLRYIGDTIRSTAQAVQHYHMPDYVLVGWATISIHWWSWIRTGTSPPKYSNSTSFVNGPESDAQMHEIEHDMRIAYNASFMNHLWEAKRSKYAYNCLMHFKS